MGDHANDTVNYSPREHSLVLAHTSQLRQSIQCNVKFMKILEFAHWLRRKFNKSEGKEIQKLLEILINQASWEVSHRLTSHK